MRRHIKQKWKSWIKKKPSHFNGWVIGYIQRCESWQQEPPKPHSCNLPNLSEKERWERNQKALAEYFRGLPENDGSHVFLSRLQTAWRAKEQERRDRSKGIRRMQLVVQSGTQKTAKDIAKRRKISVKAALEQMLNEFTESLDVMNKENVKLKKEIQPPRHDKRVDELEKDLATVLEELEKLKNYSLSHIERYCALVAEKGVEEQPKLAPEQHDQAFTRFSEKKSNINELLTKTARIQARHQKKLGKRRKDQTPPETPQSL